MTIVTPALANDIPVILAAYNTQVMIESVSQAWLAGEWRSYAARFMEPEGRIRDNGNGNVSHSEGQGYGLLLAAKAGDAARFETLWRWTVTHLMVRPDGLAAWRWDPSTKTVTDMNNATDGDILIAWALWDAARRFDRPDYRKAAEAIARSVGEQAVKASKFGPILMPGTAGFGPGEQPDGPVVNLSYWVFPAFQALKTLAPEVDWDGVRKTGLAILERSRFGTFALPTDWVSLGGPHPRPASGFPSGFSYNAIRIPLYLAMEGGFDARRGLRPFAGSWAQTATPTQLLDAKEAPVTLPINQSGYDLILALARCAALGKAIPPEMISTRSDLYYPETLRLLSVIAIQERFPSCL